jgi:hypothetical protein
VIDRAQQERDSAKRKRKGSGGVLPSEYSREFGEVLKPTFSLTLDDIRASDVAANEKERGKEREKESEREKERIEIGSQWQKKKEKKKEKEKEREILSSATSSSSFPGVHQSPGEKEDAASLFLASLSHSLLSQSFPSLTRSSSWKKRQTGLEKFPPFRFGVEFSISLPFSDLLRSSAVFYAGSWWRIYLTKWENRTRTMTLNVILVREKVKPESRHYLSSPSYYVDLRPKVHIHFKCFFYENNRLVR